MDFLRRFLRPPVLWTTGGVTVAATTIIVTRMLGMSLLLALLLVLTIALVVVVILLMRRLQQAKAAEEIEKTISRQADRDIEKSVPGQQAEMEGMKSDLLAALGALKSSRMGRRGQAALSVLPWYMVVGAAGAGKSTLVTRSGLHFPLLDEKRNPKSVKGVGGTRSFEWWLTEEAVILDMAGRTLGTAQFEDTDDWVAFLEVLRRQRKQKPLNGLVVAASLDQLAGRTDAQVEALARSVRERVQELIHHLGVVFPVYVVVTQCDRLAGFAEFFAEMPREERSQVWGATIPVERSRDEEAERLFDAEFSQLVLALSDRRMARLADVPDPVQRARAFAFPLQLERVRAGVRRFVATLFEPDPVEEGPLFRGFYFTSAKQEGAPVDRVFQPLVAELGGAKAAPPAAPQIANGAFFVRDLLTKVVFPDANLATASTRAEAGKRRGRVMLLAGLGVAFLTIAILLGALSAANGRLIGKAKRAAADAAQQVRPDAPLMQNMTALEALRSKVAVIDSLRAKKPFWRWLGGYSGDAVRDPAMQLYIEKALEALVAPAAKSMEINLTRMTDTGEGDFIHYAFLFRAWRLLTEPKQIKVDDAPVLTREFRRVLEPQLAYASPDDRKLFPQLLADQVLFLSRHSDQLAKWAPAYYTLGNPELVARATARLRNTWDNYQFYRLVVDEMPATTPVNLAGLIGTQSYLTSSAEVSGLFTRDGWTKLMKPQVDWYRAFMQRDWVVADAFQGHPPELADSLLGYYARDYSESWTRFLNSVNLPEAKDLVGAADMIRALGADDSPLVKLLRAVSDQTSLPVDPQTPIGKVLADWDMLHDFFATPGQGSGKKITSFIVSWYQKIRGQAPSVLDTSKPPSSHYQDQLREVHKLVAKAATPGAPASDIKGLMTFGTDESNPIKALLGWIDGLEGNYSNAASNEAMARVLALPITGARQAARGGIKPELNTKWQMLVYQPFQKTLAGKYPFVESNEGATIFSFQEFFRPGGTFWAFYDAELKDYILEDGTPRNPENPVPFSADFIDCLRKAYDIREGFFPGGASTPTLKFSVRGLPPKVEGMTPRMVSFDLGGRYASYLMGVQQWIELEWPGTDANAGAAVRAQAAGGAQPEGISSADIWGLFRVLDKAQFSQIDSATPQVSWTLQTAGSKIQVIYEIQPASAHHPFKPGAMRIALPANL